MEVIAIIPTYNEGKYIENILSQLKELVDCVIVSDDNSIDDTITKAENAGALVVINNDKRGFGSNNKNAIKHALSKECDVIVSLDGDGQHNPLELYKLLEPIKNGEADIVIGSRFMQNGKDVPHYRKVGIKIITKVFNIFSKNQITDSQCCYRAYKREVLESINIENSGFIYSTEVLIKARALGYKITEVPVKVFYHEELSQNSTHNPIRQGLEVALGTALMSTSYNRHTNYIDYNTNDITRLSYSKAV
jgi:glycosyltransferase involved in cell wall biosynthesis